MKISVFYDHVLEAEKQTGKTVKELLTEIKSYGIEAVEVNLTYLCEHQETYELLWDAGLKVSCIYEFYQMDAHDETEKAKLHIETACKAGAGKILVVPGFLSGEDAVKMRSVLKDYEKTDQFFSNNEAVCRMAEGLNTIANLGAQAGVSVTVEDFDDMTSPLAGVNGILWYLNRVKNLKFTFDTGNFLFYGEQIPEVWEVLKDRVVHVHCKDRGILPGRYPKKSREDFTPAAVGEGEFPIVYVLEQLKKISYDGYLAIEHYDSEDQETFMKHSAEFLKNQLCK